jgi:microcystin-dependent protein
MPININYSDNTKPPITILDDINNTQTSLTFPGRKSSGYGSNVSKDLLFLLENFANNTPPINPIEGQLWYNSNANILNIYNGANWVPAGNVHQGVKPANPTIGELWIDTASLQLNIYAGSDSWLLVGPQVSTINNQKYGLQVEKIKDTNGIERPTIIFYMADVRLFAISNSTFVPVNKIIGFPQFQAGITVSNESQIAVPFNGNATTASGLLNTKNQIVPADTVLTTTKANIVKQPISIQHDNGLLVGATNAFNISITNNTTYLYNSHGDVVIQTQSNSNKSQNVLYVSGTSIGINTNPSSSYALDVSGNTLLQDNLEVGGSTSLNGVSINGTSTFNNYVTINQNLSSQNILPQISSNYISSYNLGSTNQTWNTLYADTIITRNIAGPLNTKFVITGDLIGNALTATTLTNPSTFTLTGDITGESVSTFNGSSNVTINTQLSTTFITNQTLLDDLGTAGVGKDTDLLLVYRNSGTSSALYKSTRDNLLRDSQVPIGSILPFAGLSVPEGYLLCDGTEILIAQYQTLYNIIGTIYNSSSPLLGQTSETFRVPDLRGRFPLGYDTMNNQIKVPTDSHSSIGGTVSVTRTSYDQIGSTSTPALSLTLNGTNSTTTNLELTDPFLMINYIIRSGLPAF